MNQTKKKKILVVDDEPDFVILVKKILEKEGYVVKEAYSGRECLAYMKKETPDLIILDIMMPGISGWEVCRRIKSDRKTFTIPVIMLSIKNSKEDKEKSLFEFFADLHLDKPIGRKTLVNTVKNLIS